MSNPLMNIVSEATKRVLAPSHIAGPTRRELLKTWRLVRSNGWNATVSYWASPDDRPVRVAREMQRLLESDELHRTDSILSFKPLALGNDIGMISDLVSLAECCGLSVCFDALDIDRAAVTAKILTRLRPTYNSLYWTIPSRWNRSLKDVSFAESNGINVRLVKGQWPDPADPHRDPVEHFRRLAERLVESKIRVLVATHDAELAVETLDRLTESGTRCELEQMLGLPIQRDILDRTDLVGMRIYIPYGHADLPYALSNVRSRPAVAGWALRDIVLGRKGKLVQLGGRPVASPDISPRRTAYP